ncbi:PLP-dependent transferase [Gemella sp. zg-570]|uniref:PLP-dependent transferase n=1 Tax=Gemella sp. zg-570 TaxID=2840371 RepID=UPI001C0CB0DF|nr:PLP-dependent transferase [Gemella sp. zg-570]QWQ39131.1 PLP-dependent transferase [Gemella sp. zg-570]
MELKNLVHNSNVRKNKINSFLDFKEELIKDSLFLDLYFKYKSPKYTSQSTYYQNKILGDSFVYERNIKYNNIEEKYNSLIDNKDKILLFNSGMSAITTLITTYIEGYNKTKITILSTIGYFETDKFLKKLTFPVIYKSANNELDLVNEIISNDIDILFIEPVTYSLNMNIFDIYHIIKLFNDYSNNKKIKIIIIDITLISHFNIDIDKIKKILNKENIFCIIVQSLLKLYQFGLELTSSGMAILISNFRDEKIKNEFEKYTNTVVENRMLYGTNLNLSSLRIFTNNFLFHSIYLEKYIKKIHENNSYVAKRINNIKFKKIVHPVLKNTIFKHSKSPFILIQLNIDIESEYDKLIKIIIDNPAQEDYLIDYGSSFGFHKTRIEKIIYDINNRKCFLKIAVGYCNKNLEKIIELINNM